MGFQTINSMSTLIFVLAFGMVIAGMIRTLFQWHKNENSPRLMVEAQVVAKRADHRRTMSNKRHSGRNYTNYYVTFQFETGDRLELELKGQEYGLLVEGDKGKLTFQGSRYLGFERT